MSRTVKDLQAEHAKPAHGLDPNRWERADSVTVLVVILLVTVFFLPTFGSRPLSASHEAKAGLIARRMLQ